MPTQLTYVMEFVSDMDQTVRFYRDVLGLVLKFQSPDWSEFVTGSTSFALHPASENNPPGKIELGFGVPDLQAFYTEMVGKGFQFTQPPKMEAGTLLAVFSGPNGMEYTVSQIG